MYSDETVSSAKVGSFKRETSVSVDHLHTVSESIKRLALSQDGLPYHSMPGISENSSNNSSNSHNNRMSPIQLENLYVKNGSVLASILSNATEDFASKYDLIQEIGRGGFSTVFKCKEKATEQIFAVKVIDLRPLRLRERFNPSRLRREVDIMRRLNHPNIIKFIEVFETPDHLMMVMEYCPGDELFDVILARKYYTENDAKPIFAQIARSLHYLHSLNIIHRDIKPENVLILHQPDPITGHPMAKLLDFGLSKNAGAGSAAKTFVGTPCYLSPEVEYTSKGVGGTYGLPADCWSLGAVLYVMLVARFPEFEQDTTGKVVLRLPPALWSDVSSDAKDLIRSLMNTNPAARLTVSKALQHPWLAEFKMSTEELTKIALECYDFGVGLQEEEAEVEMTEEKGSLQQTEFTPGGIAVHRQAMVVRHLNTENSSNASEQLHLSSLLHLQRSIAACFDEAHQAYKEFPEVATQVRRGAGLCREQLTESTKMLRKVERTASEVLNLFPDLELAVEEGEPQMAAAFFNLVRGWVVELRETVSRTQEVNKESMNQIQKIVEQSTIGLDARRTNTTSNIHALAEKFISKSNSNSFTADEALELFMNLFSTVRNSNVGNSTSFGKDNILEHSRTSPDITQIDSINSDDLPNPSSKSVHVTSRGASFETAEEEDVEDVDMFFDEQGEDTGIPKSLSSSKNLPTAPPSCLAMPSSIASNSSSSDAYGRPMPLVIPKPATQEENQLYMRSPHSTAAHHLAEALVKLRQVDVILEQLSVFWANTEVILDVLTKKGQHVEHFIGFASKPRLLARFRERMEEYKRFWESIASMCNNYVVGVNQSGADAKRNNQLYGFLE